MFMDLKLNLTQEQKLILTQQMQLSIKLLQMSSIELIQYIDKELQENPILESTLENGNSEIEKEVSSKLTNEKIIKYLDSDYYEAYYPKNDEDVSPFNFIGEKQSLKDFLKKQVSELEMNKYSKFVCEYIIENIDYKGYFDSTLENISEELKMPKAYIEKCLSLVQSLEPDGIGARNLSECLKIQLMKKRYKDENLYKIVDEYLKQIADNKFNIIAKDLQISLKQVQSYSDIIKSLEPKPSRGFFTGEEVRYIIPDAYIKKIDSEYFVITNDDLLPRLGINRVYKEILSENKDKEAVEYIKEKLNSAVSLIKGINQRKSTIYKVLEEILKIQKEYFDKGEDYLKPMILKEVALSINMHESTVSRAIRDKYVYTNRGTIKIKDLFTNGITSTDSNEDISTLNIKKEIKIIIEGEDRTKPLSDQNIWAILNSKGMNISRRTVAKYREQLGIKASSKRKRF